MAISYFKRFRMQCDLREWKFEDATTPAPYLHDGFEFRSWNSRLLAAHAEAKFRSFRNELDCNVFPCLGESEGCVRLMREITSRQGFVPQATWLLTYIDPISGQRENCGTVQGIREQKDVGSIQNIGIVAQHRGKGLGSRIVNHCLRGFQEAGVEYVRLEVTAHNTGAFRLYERLGFKVLKVVFKSAEVVYQ